MAGINLPALMTSVDPGLFIASPSMIVDAAPAANQRLWIMGISGFVTSGPLTAMGALRIGAVGFASVQ